MNNPWDEIKLPSKDVNARRIDPAHLLDLFWAQDHLGHYLFIYEFSSDENPPKVSLPDLIGIKGVYVSANSGIAKNRLILLLNDKSNWEIFLSLCNDLIQATRNAKNSIIAVQAILNRLEHWQEFLKNNRSGILGEEKILGLIGELLFIKNNLIPIFGAGQSIKFWQGPEGLPQDFNVNESAIEVKCQSGATSPYIKISSADQLCPQLPEMYLFVVTLGIAAPETMNAVNLPMLILQIRDALKSEASEQVERFNDLLHSLGYIDSDRYLDFNYILAGEKMFQVIEGFPRICSHELHRGIANLSYSISLLECAPFEKLPDWMKGIK
jgi:hypothetical protein